MAAATTILAGAGLALGAGGSVAKMIGGAKQKRAARRAARNFKRQELRNVNEGRRISTRGADLAREEAARRTATSVEALRSGGIRGVVGGLSGVNEANIAESRRVGRDLDLQQMQLDRDIATDEANMRAIQENRDNQELAAIQAQMNAGNQQMYSGMGDLAQVGFGAATSGLFGGSTPQVDPLATSIQPAVTGSALVDSSIIAPVFTG